ncbi:MAG: hypothetical protein VB980_00135, partial [Opitutales bacterium]
AATVKRGGETPSRRRSSVRAIRRGSARSFGLGSAWACEANLYILRLVLLPTLVSCGKPDATEELNANIEDQRLIK